MSITSSLDGWDHVRNFEEVYVGPGIYVLFAGQACDKNIVYIGKSEKRVVARVRTHRKDKGFDRVGVFLPSRTSSSYIHNAEHFILAEFLDRFGRLPRHNNQFARFKRGGPRFNWHSAPRRSSDVQFGGRIDQGPLGSDSGFRTVGELRRISDDLHGDGMPRWETFEWLALDCDYVYEASTLRQYFYSDAHGNTVLPAFR